MSTKNKQTVKRKREEAKERQDHWNRLSPQQRIESLDKRPGHSKKERARIIAALEELKKAIKAS